MFRYGKCDQVVKPKPKCPKNSDFNGVKCICKKGFFEISPGVCGTCPPLQYWNGQKCSYNKICLRGF